MSYKKMATDHSRNGSSKSTMSNSIISEGLKNQKSLQKSFEEYNDYELSISLTVIAMHISGKVDGVFNGLYEGDKILSAFSNHLGSRCIYSFDSGGHLCFEFKDNSEKFLESLESGLLVVLGIFACYRVNLDILEKKSSILKGLNNYLLNNCPETYKAYNTLSKEFDFDSIGPIEIGDNVSQNPSAGKNNILLDNSKSISKTNSKKSRTL
jgi:hypothetical protein